LFSYQTTAEAAEALNAIAGDYSRHAAAARSLAERYFDSKRVLVELLERVM
jgi:hypothetical protein